MVERKRVVDVMKDRLAVDPQGVPVLEKVGAKLTTLERMREHRQEQLDDLAQGRGKISEGVAGHYRKEVDAISAAEVALRYHRGTIENLDTPFSVLREIVDAYEGPAVQELKLRDAVRKAKSVLAEYGQVVT